MNILDIILGRAKPKEPMLERLFAISTAQISLQANLSLVPAPCAALCFKPVTSSSFETVQKEIEDLLRITEKGAGTKARTTRDSYGFEWIIFEDDDFESLVAAVHMVSESLRDGGYGTRLLAAVFKFEGDDKKVYWIYNYKRGNFYPFVPLTQNESRDGPTEFRLSSVMAEEMPIEPEMERWYPMWSLPL